MSTLALACAGACVPLGGSADVALERDDLVIFATATAQDEPQVVAVDAFVAAGPEDSRGFVTPNGAPFFVFRVPLSALAGAARPLTRGDLVAARVVRADAELPGGSCGRCLAPAAAPPLVVHDGGACRLPAFVEGELYTPTDGGFVPRVDPSAERAVAAARRQIRIDWPGACACRDTGPGPSLAGLEIEPIAPEGGVWPFERVAEGSSGVVAAFGDRAAIAFDREGGAWTTRVTELDRFPAEIQAVTALRDGGFLLASVRENEAFGDGFRFDRVGVATDGTPGGYLTEPVELETDTIARPRRLRYLSETGDLPLWMIGAATADFNIDDGALFACRESPLECTRANVAGCAGDQASVILDDALILPDGSGLGVSRRALYLKAPGMSATEPRPEEPWRCTTYDSAFPWRAGLPEGTAPIPVRPFSAVAHVGARAFVCGLREPPPCEPHYPVVLTATVSAAPGQIPAPRWEIVARARDGLYCHGFLPVPGDPSRVRLMFNDGRTIDLDERGAVVAEGRIGDLFGAGALGWLEVGALPSGNVFARTRENGLYFGDGASPFEQLYGPAPPVRASYGEVVAAGDAFFVFGHPDGVTRVGATRDASGAPERWNLERLRDPGGALRPSDHVRDVIVDTSATAANPGSVVLVVAGYSDGSPIVPLLRRLRVDGGPGEGTLGGFDDLPVPASIAGLALDGVAETGPNHFVAIVQDTRVIDVDAEAGAFEVDLDFDDPTTPDREVRPTTSPGECGGPAPRLDAFRDIDGASGVAWVVGKNGMIFRIAAGRAERFVPTVEEVIGSPVPTLAADLTHVRASCPDRALITGEYSRGNGEGGRSLTVWRVAPRGATGECFPTAGAPEAPGTPEEEALVVRELREDPDARCLNLPPTSSIPFSRPRQLLVDRDAAAVLLEDGFIHRFQPERAPRPGEATLRVPFPVAAAAQNTRGELLFSGTEARLAIGVPGASGD